MIKRIFQQDLSFLRKLVPPQLQQCSGYGSSTMVSSDTCQSGFQPGAREFFGNIRQVKTSPMKMNLVAKLIRGMPIADALAQIQFCEKKAANFIEKVLLDTQRKAVQEHEADPLSLWIAESFVGKGQYRKKIRYHGRGMHGVMDVYHAHYFLKLKEGKPPKKKKSVEDSWKYRTKKFIQAGPRSIPNSL